MNIDFTRLLYIIMTTCIIFLVGVLFINLLPWLILIGAVFYIIYKVKLFIKLKKLQKSNNSYTNTSYNPSNASNEESFYTSGDDDYSGEIIDVDYYEEADEDK